jgi:hypothetical protein
MNDELGRKNDEMDSTNDELEMMNSTGWMMNWVDEWWKGFWRTSQPNWGTTQSFVQEWGTEQNYLSG